MNTEQKILNREQNLLVAELQSAYGLKSDEIIFFTDEPNPFFSYEATCVLCNRLTDLRGIDVEPINNGFVDSVSYRCTLTQADGSTRSAVGVANVDEKDADGRQLKSSQLIELASGRAIRSALRIASIDLLKLHDQSKRGPGGVQFSGPPLDNRQKLLRQAHALGYETGLITETKDADTGFPISDKRAWYIILRNRYSVPASSHLTDERLADFVAFLRSQLPTAAAAA